MAGIAGGQLERIARGATASLAGAAVSAVAGFTVVVIVTQAFSRTDAGALFSASSLFVIVLAVVGLGIDAGLGRFLLRHVAERRWDWAHACLRNTAAVTAVSGTIATAIMWVLAEPVASLIGLPAAEGPTVVRLFAMAVVASAMGNWALGASRAFANIRQTVLIEKLCRSILQLVLVAACAWTATDLTTLSLAWALPSVLLAPVALLGLRRVVRAMVPASAARAPEATREFWRFTTPRSIAQVAQLIVQRIDIILIAALLSPAAAAVYTAATRFVPLGQLGTQAIQQVVQPRFTHLLATGQRGALAEVVRTTTAWNVAVAWPLYLVVGSMAGVYLQLFGQGFASDGLAVVVIMVLGMLVGVASGPVDTILLMSGRSWLSLGNALLALVVDVIGCLILIPPMGIAGAAVAWSAAVIVKSALGFAAVWRFEGLSPLSKASRLVMVASAVCFALPGLALSLLGLANLLTLLALLASGGYCYFRVLRRSSGLLRLEALRALLPRGRGTL